MVTPAATALRAFWARYGAERVPAGQDPAGLLRRVREGGGRKEMAIVVYCLGDGTGRRSYIGYTVNLVRRLRQHRGELRGGARATRGWSSVRLLGYVAGFLTPRAAQAFERACKNVRRRGRHGRARLTNLFETLARPRWAGAALVLTIPAG